MACSLVPVANVDGTWPLISEGLHRAVMRTGGDWTVGQLWQACRSGSAFLICAHSDTEILGASIWQPDTWQSGPKLRCLALYGRGMGGWIGPMHDMAKRVAKDCGAESLVADGRPGWAKIFPNAKMVRAVYEERL